MLCIASSCSWVIVPSDTRLSKIESILLFPCFSLWPKILSKADFIASSWSWLIVLSDTKLSKTDVNALFPFSCDSLSVRAFSNADCIAFSCSWVMIPLDTRLSNGFILLFSSDLPDLKADLKLSCIAVFVLV